MDEPPSKTILYIQFIPDSAYPLVFTVVVLSLLAVALFSASEAAFFSLQPKDLDLCRRRKKPADIAVLSILGDPYLLLVSMTIANILARVVALMGCVLFLGDPFQSSSSFPALVTGTTILFVLLGDLLPRLVGSEHQLLFARRTAAMWKTLGTILKPISMPIAKRLRHWSQTGSLKETKADLLNQAIELAEGLEGTSEEEKDILKGIANFGTLQVGQVMRIRNEVFAIPTNTSFTTLMEQVKNAGFSRIPIFADTMDKILGILYIKDLLPFLDNHDGFEWQSLIRPGYFVLGTKKIDLLLKDFQEKRVHMAIVIDEYGSTRGLVTLEDLIEEIIGEINDEFDDVDLSYKKIDSNTFLFDGKTSLGDFCKAVDVPLQRFPDFRVADESIGDLLITIHQKIPRTGDQITYEQFTFGIESADRRKIKRIRVKIHEQAQ